MLKRLATRLVLNFRVVMLVTTSILLFLGVVSIYNQFNWFEPHIGLVAVRGESFVHITGDGSGLVESQSRIRQHSEEELLRDDLQVLEYFEGRQTLGGGRELLIRWTFDFEKFDKGLNELSYQISKGGKSVDSRVEEFDSYGQLFEKVAAALGIGGTVEVGYYPKLKGAEGTPPPERLSVMARRVPPQVSQYLLAAVGFAFLVVGFIVYFSGASRRVANTTHFLFICLAFFVLFVYEFTTGGAPLGWVIFWAGKAAFLFAPVILLHFFYLFSFSGFGSVWTGKTLGFYLPSTLLLLASVVTFDYRQLALWVQPRRVAGLDQLYGWLQKAEMLLFGLLVVASLVVLFRAFRATDSVEKKKQLKWLFWGTGIGLMPTVLLAFPLALLEQPTRVVDVIVSIPLFVLPLCFAYAVFRHKLMDVEVIFKRGFVYFVSSFSVVALYLLLMFGLNIFGGSIGTPALIVVGGLMILLATLFSHQIKDRVQGFFDRLLYSDFYNFRRTLQRFSHELSYERDLDRLLAKISGRIGETFNLPVVMIFIASPDRRHFILLYPAVGNFPTHYLGEESSRKLRERLLSGAPLPVEKSRQIPAGIAFEKAGVKTLIPFVSLGEVIGFMALGNKADGDILNTDDLQLLSSLASRAAISLDNAMLYLDLQNRAEELRRLKEFNENIVESVSSGICVVDTEGQVQSWNYALTELFGVEHEAAIGKPLLELLPAPLPDILRPYLAAVGEDSGSFSSLYKVKVQAGENEEVVLNISFAPLSSGEGTTGSVIIIDDISDWVSMEDQLVQREKLASLGLLAAGVAHEVNTPLTGISSYVQLLQRRLDGDEEAKALLRKVESQAFRASKIVNNLLNFSRGGPSELVEIDMNALVGDALVLLENQLRSSEVMVATDLRPDLHKIVGDRGKLQQVIINLLLNAADSMPEGGEIRISTRNEGDAITLSVTDKGLGIPEEVRGRIYDPFFTTKKMGKGSGLGLSVSYGIIQEHSGKIEMESDVGMGTKFIISLPAAPRSRAVPR